jgi:hypothetical protein
MLSIFLLQSLQLLLAPLVVCLELRELRAFGFKFAQSGFEGLDVLWLKGLELFEVVLFLLNDGLLKSSDLGFIKLQLPLFPVRH